MGSAESQGDWLEIRLVGQIPSKKNLYKRSKYTRGRKGMYKDEATVALLKAAGAQIPAYARGLKIENPDIEWEFQIPSVRFDRDNAKVAVVDLLKDHGVIVDDNFKNLNGHEHTYPARLVRDEPMITTIRLKPGDPNWWKR